MSLVTSVIARTETLTKPIKEGETEIESDYRRFFQQPKYMTVSPVTEVIADRAASLRARYGLRTPDALHLATAIELDCDAFLTNDLGIKKVAEINVIVLDELELPSDADPS